MFHFAKVNIELAKILHPSRNTVKHPKRPKFASSKTLAKVSCGDLATFYQRLKTPKVRYSVIYSVPIKTQIKHSIARQNEPNLKLFFNRVSIGFG